MSGWEGDPFGERASVVDLEWRSIAERDRVAAGVVAGERS